MGSGEHCKHGQWGLGPSASRNRIWRILALTAGGNSFKNATACKVNTYYTIAISYCTFCVEKHTILGPARYGSLVYAAGRQTQRIKTMTHTLSTVNVANAAKFVSTDTEHLLLISDNGDKSEMWLKPRLRTENKQKCMYLCNSYAILHNHTEKI